ncbi:hypothetical protein J4217_03245 [Candidatus Pacearchaeota archaeon]|nr:hypothetical protein [Candidatus Pacearchaeota archaeon]
MVGFDKKIDRQNNAVDEEKDFRGIKLTEPQSPYSYYIGKYVSLESESAAHGGKYIGMADGHYILCPYMLRSFKYSSSDSLPFLSWVDEPAILELKSYRIVPMKKEELDEIVRAVNSQTKAKLLANRLKESSVIAAPDFDQIVGFGFKTRLH